VEGAFVMDSTGEAGTQKSSLLAFAANLNGVTTTAEVAQVALSHGIVGLGALAGMMSIAGQSGTYGRSMDDADTMSRGLRTAGQRALLETIRTGESIWYEGSAARSALACVPMTRQGKIWGAICFFFSGERMFTARERAVITSLSYHCIRALERCRAYEAEQRARQSAEKMAVRLAQLQRVTTELNRSSDEVTIATVVAREALAIARTGT